MFSTFPREIAYPKSRKTIYRIRKLIEKINLYNGRRNLYTSVYSFSHIKENMRPDYSSAIIDKMYFDLDGYDSHSQIKIFHEYLKEKNIRHYMQFSGRGFNMFVFTEKEDLENKRIALRSCQKEILKEIGIPIVRVTKENRDSESGCDKQILGDLARVCRLPCTFNLRGKRFCIPLSEKTLYLNLDEIHKIAKKQPCGKLSIYGKNKLSLKEYDKEEYDIDYAAILDKEIQITDSKIDLYLPCIRNICRNENPGQYERFALVCWLSEELRWGFSLQCVNEIELENKIVNFIEKLDWDNYNRSKTAYQVSHIVKNMSRACSCQWMMEYGICIGKCEFFDDRNQE